MSIPIVWPKKKPAEFYQYWGRYFERTRVTAVLQNGREIPDLRLSHKIAKETYINGITMPNYYARHYPERPAVDERCCVYYSTSTNGSEYPASSIVEFRERHW